MQAKRSNRRSILAQYLRTGSVFCGRLLARVTRFVPRRVSTATTLMLTVIGLFLSMVGYTLVGRQAGQAYRITQQATENSPFSGTLQLVKLRHDRSDSALSADLILDITATSSSAEISSVCAGLQPTHDSTPEFPKQDLLWFPDEKTKLISTLDTTDPSRHRESTQIILPLRLRAGQIRGEVFFPFDAYQFSLKPIVCVNDITDRTPVGEITLRFDEGQFAEFSHIINGSNDFTVFVTRPRFFIVTSVWLALTSLVFLLYLMAVQEPRKLLTEALGYFAAVWALRQVVVPEPIKIFPTSVDYFTITIFGMLFIIVTFRTLVFRHHAGGKS